MINEKIEILVDYSRINAKHSGIRPYLTTYVQNELRDIIGKSFKKRPAVIICPGGGYVSCSEREGEPVAMRFLAAGFHSFVLNYSCAPAKYPAALMELARAVSIVRERADEWNVDKNRIVVCGFSAGGHLAASLGVFWHEEFLPAALGLKGKEHRPNALILGYPVITSGRYAHRGSFISLVGDIKDKAKMERVSLERQVSKQTPPTFLWHTQEDDTVPVENSLMFSFALRKNKVPFELHIFEKGVHGMSLCDDTTSVLPSQALADNKDWITMAVNFMKRI